MIFFRWSIVLVSTLVVTSNTEATTVGESVEQWITSWGRKNTTKYRAPVRIPRQPLVNCILETMEKQIETILQNQDLIQKEFLKELNGTVTHIDEKLRSLQNSLINKMDNLNCKQVTCDSLGAEMIGNQCLLISEEKKSTFDGARAACKAMDATLAVVKNPMALRTYLLQKGLHGVWVGATDIAKEGTWLWLDWTMVDNVLWAPSEPGRGGSDENCLVHHPDGYHSTGCANDFNYACDMGVY